jgi:hypothetical protein
MGFGLLLASSQALASFCDDPDVCLKQALDARLAGDESAALARLDALLSRFPDRLRARAERALSLLQLGRAEESIQELDSLLASELPPNVRANLVQLRDQALSQLAGPPGRNSLRFSLGHDDNVTSFADYDPRLGADGPTLGTVGGSPDSYAEVGGRLRWRGVAGNAIQTRADADFSARRHRELHEFDLDDLRLRASAELHATPRLGIQLSPSFRHIQRGRDALLNDTGIELAMGFSASRIALRAGLERASRRYSRASYRGLDAEHWALNLRSQIAFGARNQWWLGGDLEYRDEQARSRAQNRELQRIGLSLGLQQGRHELVVSVDGNSYRYREPGAAETLIRVPITADNPLDVLVRGARDLRYRGGDVRYRFSFHANWTLQLRLRRLLADIDDAGPRYDRTSLDFGVEWNR